MVAVGLMIGGIATLIFLTTEPSPSPVGLSPATTDIHIDVRVVLEEPTATMTEIPTVTRTVPPTTSAIPFHFCGTATPGSDCQQAPALTPTMTQYPFCGTPTPDAWCRWPD